MVRMLPASAAAWLLAGAAAAAEPPDPAACKDLARDPADASWTTCDAAIAAEGDPRARAVMHYRKGFAHNERQDAEAALPDLDAAVILDPENWHARQERAYTLGELGRYADAIADLDVEERLNPSQPSLYQERAFARFLAADFKGAYADWNRKARLVPLNGDDLLGRARAGAWMGRLDEATNDLDRARALVQEQGDSVEEIDTLKASIALWRGPGSGDPAKGCLMQDLSDSAAAAVVVADCTKAFFAAPTNAAKVHALTVRASALVVALQKSSSQITDLQIAVALDPGNASAHANLGFAYTSDGHSWAGRRAFDRALALEPSAFALGGRAMAEVNLGDYAAARTDARRAMEMGGSAPALVALGDIAFDHENDPATARAMWLGAWRMGVTGDELRTRLRQVGVENPENAVRGPTT